MNSVYRFTLAACVSVFATSAFTATDAAEIFFEPTSQLLSTDVIEAAETEADLPTSFDAATAVTDQASEPAQSFLSPTVSLAQLVSRHAAPNADTREAECLAVAVFYEAKSEALEGQLAVANTVINRARSGRFPASFCGVVAQPGQFSFVRNGRIPAVAQDRRDWHTAVAIAHIARNQLWSSKVGNALFFHAKRVSPGWRLTRIGSIGNHIFYR